MKTNISIDFHICISTPLWHNDFYFSRMPWEMLFETFQVTEGIVYVNFFSRNFYFFCNAMAILIFAIASEVMSLWCAYNMFIGITHFKLNGLILQSFEMLLMNIAFPRISALGTYLRIDVGVALFLEGRT